MQYNKLKTCLLIFAIILSTRLMANISQPADYYLSIHSPLLVKTEQYHLQQAIDKLLQQDLEQAWNELAFVLHYFPNHPKALSLLSDLSFKMKQPARAKRYFERALSLYPDHASTYTLYGEFLMRDAKYTEAVSQFKKAAVLDKSFSKNKVVRSFFS